MTRFHGAVGYADQDQETSDGVWEPVIVERTYTGDVIRSARRQDSTSVLTDNVTLENSFSIVGDAYANANFTKMRYVSWMGTNWTVTNVEVRRPRLIVTVGDVWNGSTAT